MERVLFVCTGNTCRSPMAEAIFHARRPKENFTAKSAGVHAQDGMPMSEGSRQAIARHGMMESHQSQPLTEELLQWSDLILTMTEAHKQAVIEQFPDRAALVHTLKEYVNDDQETLDKMEELKHNMAQMEMKRAQFIAENQNKVDKYNEEQDIGDASGLEQELLSQIEPHQRAIDRLEWDLPSFDIRDPFGGDDSIYEATFQEIEEAVDQLLKKMNTENEGE
ncbi:low molecular weight protein arginine phosphatase [Alkalicoccus chagannorensis]|uniref:low molecular weight protein arginine phosphatase n=1 Tax=Alkalicoccus chagannorensis TaxID=427072 RepID=UPI000414F23E|nr:low molecular weight protein arginine phosphatase [Alkalicoccus chagannorensis]